MALAELPIVDEALLAEAVRRIRMAGDPLKIVLFGSHARGTPHEHSDLDLLIIEENAGSMSQPRATKYYMALGSLHPAKDIIVYSPEEIADWANVTMAFPTTIMREGRVLYERPF